MGKFMNSDLKILKFLHLSKFIFVLEIFICHVNESHIFHTSDSEFWAEYIVILLPWEGCLEEVFIKQNSRFKDSEKFSWINELDFSLPDSNPNWNFKFFVVIIND